VTYDDHDFSDLEIQRGALSVYCPHEERHLFVRPTDVITLGPYAWSLFELDRSQEAELVDRARRLELLLMERGR